MSLHRLLSSLLLCSIFQSSEQQFAEIASLATSLLTNGLGGAGLASSAAGAAGTAGQAVGALSQIGQLYQLAQGALQLTGTGVGVLNQASEGNWFPALLEHTAKTSHAGGGLPPLGVLGPSVGSGGTSNKIGPEFGTNFPSPNPEDYNETIDIEKETKKEEETETKTGDKLDGDGEGEGETTGETATAVNGLTGVTGVGSVEEVTLIPEGNEIEELKPEKPTDLEQTVSTELKVTNQVETSLNKDKDDGDSGLLENVARTHGTKTKGVPNLSRLLETLRKANLSDKEIEEIVKQIEGNKEEIDLSSGSENFDLNSAVRNIEEDKLNNRDRITSATRQIVNNLASQGKIDRKEFAHNLNQLRVLPDLTSHAQIQPQVTQPSLIQPHAFTHLPQYAQYSIQPNYGQPQVQLPNNYHPQPAAYSATIVQAQTLPNTQGPAPVASTIPNTQSPISQTPQTAYPYSPYQQPTTSYYPYYYNNYPHYMNQQQYAHPQAQQQQQPSQAYYNYNNNAQPIRNGPPAAQVVQSVASVSGPPRYGAALNVQNAQYGQQQQQRYAPQYSNQQVPLQQQQHQLQHLPVQVNPQMSRNIVYSQSQQQQQVVQRNTVVPVAPQMHLPVASRVANIPAATNNNQNQRTNLPNSVDGRARKTRKVRRSKTKRSGTAGSRRQKSLMTSNTSTVQQQQQQQQQQQPTKVNVHKRYIVNPNRAMNPHP